jgi:type II secretory pathway component PulM
LQAYKAEAVHTIAACICAELEAKNRKHNEEYKSLLVKLQYLSSQLTGIEQSLTNMWTEQEAHFTQTENSQSTSTALSIISLKINKLEFKKIEQSPVDIAEKEKVVKETVAKWIEGVKSGVSVMKEQIHKIFI